jgi:hypothetical protein
VFTEHIDGAHHGIGIVEAQREKIVFRYLNVDDGSVLDEVRLSGAGPWPWGEPEILACRKLINPCCCYRSP